MHKDEAPNAEADITGISFEDNILASARFNLNPSYNDNLQAYPILVKVKEGTPLNKLSPLFELTPGATISPESGSEHDFSDGKRVKYTVTSENKAWQRVYSIGVREQSVSDIPNEFHFEDIRLINGINPKYKYQEFYERTRRIGTDMGPVEMKDSTGQPVHQLLKITLRHNMTMVKTESVPN